MATSPPVELKTLSDRANIIAIWKTNIFLWNNYIIELERVLSESINAKRKGSSSGETPEASKLVAPTHEQCTIFSYSELSNEVIERVQLKHDSCSFSTTVPVRQIYSMKLVITFKRRFIDSIHVAEHFARAFRGLCYREGENNDVVVTLSFHRKKRLQPMFLYLIERCGIPKDITDALWRSLALYRRYRTDERDFYKGLSHLSFSKVSTSDEGKSTFETLVTTFERFSAGNKEIADSKGAKDIAALIKRAEVFDTHYLKDWQREHPIPREMNPTFNPVLPCFTRHSEALYSLAEACFQEKDFENARKVLAEITQEDTMFFLAQLMTTKILFATYDKERYAISLKQLMFHDRNYTTDPVDNAHFTPYFVNSEARKVSGGVKAKTYLGFGSEQTLDVLLSKLQLENGNKFIYRFE